MQSLGHAHARRVKFQRRVARLQWSTRVRTKGAVFFVFRFRGVQAETCEVGHTNQGS